MKYKTQHRLGNLARKILPRHTVRLLKRCARPWLLAPVRKAFDQAPTSPEWLGPAELATLMQKYPTMTLPPPHELQPDFSAAAEVLREIETRSAPCQRVLEVGLAEGMVAAALCARGKSVFGIDLVDTLHPRARAAGVNFRKMDACDLDFPDATFDAVYSFHVMEHIHDPQAALREAARVTRPGGRIYICFSPLYMSAWGQHAGLEVGVPYCQHLFPKETLKTVIRSEGFWYLNEWRLEQYRALWKSFKPMLKTVRYREEMDLLSLNLIRAYPSCFKSKSQNLEEFLVSEMRVTFEVLPTPTPAHRSSRSPHGVAAND